MRRSQEDPTRHWRAGRRAVCWWGGTHASAGEYVKGLVLSSLHGGQPPVVYLFSGEIFRAESTIVMQWHTEQEGHDKFTLVHPSKE
jgi:hypothetical protein